MAYMKFRDMRVKSTADDKAVPETFMGRGWADGSPLPPANRYFIKYRVRGGKEWEIAEPAEINFTVRTDGLRNGTMYEVVAVSALDDDLGKEVARAESFPHLHLTPGTPIQNTHPEDAAPANFLGKTKNPEDPTINPCLDDDLLPETNSIPQNPPTEDASPANFFGKTKKPEDPSLPDQHSLFPEPGSIPLPPIDEDEDYIPWLNALMAEEVERFERSTEFWGWEDTREYESWSDDDGYEINPEA